MPIFKKNGYIIHIKRQNNESFERMTKRGLFIVSQKPNNKKEKKEAEELSELYALIEGGNIFSEITMNKIKECKKKMIE